MGGTLWVYTYVCSFLVSSLLWEGRQRLPKQRSTRVEVMEGTGSDKMYREPKSGERGQGTDKYSRTQATTARDSRGQQWQQKSRAQVAWMASSETMVKWSVGNYWELNSLKAGLEVCNIRASLFRREKRKNLPNLTVYAIGFPDSHLKQKQKSKPPLGSSQQKHLFDWRVTRPSYQESQK